MASYRHIYLSIYLSIFICLESTKNNMTITYSGQGSETTMVLNTAPNT